MSTACSGEWDMALQISYPASEYLGEVDHFKVGDAPQSVLDLPDTGASARRMKQTAFPKNWLTESGQALIVDI